MLRTIGVAVLASVLGGASLAGQVPEVLSRPFGNGLTLHADLYRAHAADTAPAVLLFHQGGGDARGEYGDIIPELLRAGFHVLSADLRGGGNRFGASRASAVGPEFRYCMAAQDMNAAIDLARAQRLDGPLVLWGSSFSATLAVQAAARRSADVAAVLAFSPAGGPLLAECEIRTYLPWLEKAEIPVLVLRPAAEVADSTRAAALEEQRRLGAQVFVAADGAHGSSMLVAARVEGSTALQWRAVREFLQRARNRARTAPDVVIESGEWNLYGNLTRPPHAASAPAVLLLHKAGGSRTVYDRLAAALAARGLASLRVDLRGHGASIEKGRFIPGVSSAVIDSTHHDVAAALAWLRRQPGIDSNRVGIVAGSYSAEAAARAIRDAAPVRAFAALSPGDFSDTSFASMHTAAHWLFARADNELFVREWLDDKVRAAAPRAEVWVIPAGAAHATDLLLADATLDVRIADWLRSKL